MKRITCQFDLVNLRLESALPLSLITAVEAYFEQLREASGLEFQGHEFVLDCGYIFVLEKHDTELDLRPLLDSWPEYGEILRDSEPPVTKCVVLRDNDWIDTVFAIHGQHLSIEEWIEPHLEA